MPRDQVTDDDRDTDELYHQVLDAVAHAGPAGRVETTTVFSVAENTTTGPYHLLDVRLTVTRHPDRHPSIAADALIRHGATGKPRRVPLPDAAIDRLATLALSV